MRRPVFASIASPASLSLALLVAACGDSGAGTATESITSPGTTAGPGATESASGETDSVTGMTGVSMTGTGTATGTSGPSSETSVSDATGSSGTLGTSDTTDPFKFDMGDNTSGGGCTECSDDLHEVIDCDTHQVIEVCEGTDGCDAELGECINACEAADNNNQSVGCEYYPTLMQHWDGQNKNRCFAAFVANTWNTPANLSVSYNGQAVDLGQFAKIPVGAGPGLSLDPYDPGAGLAPGEVAVLFLAGPQGPQGPGQANCPVNAAVPNGVHLAGTGIANAFHIVSDVPVVAYQINPYGGGSAAVTGASLLLPTSVWDTNYVVVNPLPASIGEPSANIIAHQDNTTVTIEPITALVGGGGIPGGPAGDPINFTLDAGQHAQLTQNAELTGSIVMSDKPVGLMGGHSGMQAPVGTAYSDHAEQMIPPVQALGSEYVGVMHRPRVSEPGIWRVVGALDGTQLDWEPDVGGPPTLDRGTKAEFVTDQPFVVRSQDEEHPFLLFNIMSGSTWQPGLNGYGDSDYVISVPTDQYMPGYVFFADPTYPETNLVLVRKRVNDQFWDVELDCLGVVGGWQPVGDFEWARVDLITGDFMDVGGCSTGRHEITSDGGRFGLWVWGWGTPESQIFTQNVSYGYPGGMNVQPINDVILIPE